MTRTDDTNDDGVFEYEAVVDLHSNDKVPLDLITVRLKQLDGPEEVCHFNFDGSHVLNDSVGVTYDETSLCHRIGITNVQKNLVYQPETDVGYGYGYGYGYEYGWGVENVSWTGYGYKYGYGYEDYTEATSMSGEVVINFEIDTNEGFEPDKDFNVQAGVSGVEDGNVKFTYYNKNPLTFISVVGMGGPMFFNTESSQVSPAYVMEGESGILNFTIKKDSPDLGSFKNLTITLPQGFSYVENNGSSVTPVAEYEFLNTSSNGLNKLVWNATNHSLGFWHNDQDQTQHFWFNVSAPEGRTSHNFQIEGATIGGSSGSFNLSVFTTTPFSYNGTVKDSEGNLIANATASLIVTGETPGMEGPPTTLGIFEASTNNSGVFNITNIPSLQNMTNLTGPMGPGAEGTLSYQLSVEKPDTENPNRATQISTSLPEIPVQELVLGVSDPTVVLKPAIAFNVSAVGPRYAYNESGVFINGSETKSFFLEIKDQNLGYAVKDVEESRENVITSVPKGENYTLSLRPEMSFPLNIRFNDITSTCNGTGFDIDGVNTSCTEYGPDGEKTYQVNVRVNTSSEMKPVAGYFKNIESPTEMRVVSYSMQGQSMVFENWPMPFNMGRMAEGSGQTDYYNTTTGKYNISLPATSAPSYLMLRAYAKNATGYYMGTKRITAMGGDFTDVSGVLNFTMQKLINGTSRSITSNNASAEFWNETTIANTAAVNFRLVNSTGSLLTDENAFVELERTLNGDPYKQMSNAQGGQFNVSLKEGESLEDLTIYSQTKAPISMPVSSDILMGATSNDRINCTNDGVCDITMRSFETRDAEGNKMENITIQILKSSPECNGASTPSSCVLEEMDEEGFSPLRAILSGDINFKIAKSGVAGVMYINTNLLASGPPDVSFTENATTTEGGLAAAWKFGSQGPDIYDEVIIAFPYNQSRNISNITIPKLYDNDFNVIWNTTNNDTEDLIGTQFEDYLNTSYEAYLNGTGVECSTTDSNFTTSLCYKNTSQNIVYIKIPHFSGVGPEINYEGEAPTTTTTTTTSTTTSTSGDGGAAPGAGTTTVSTSTTSTSTSTTTTIERIPITSKAKKEEILKDTGIKEEDTEITQLGEKKEKKETLTKDILDAAEDLATEDKAKEAVDKIRRAAEEGKSIDVTTSIETYEAKDKTTGETSYLSKISISFTASEDMEDVEIVEVIPKDVAAEIGEVIFHGDQPEVLQADPVVRWAYDKINKGEKKELSYTVDKKVTEKTTKTLAASGVEEEPEGWWDWKKITGIVILIIAIVLLIYVERERLFGGRKS